ncbi:MAG: hypothetical protein JO071_13855 [Deltaproteobacteria bacterium]|nr:hypothetical protein [Deltaproteobacteria bacterium]
MSYFGSMSGGWSRRVSCSRSFVRVVGSSPARRWWSTLRPGGGLVENVVG